MPIQPGWRSAVRGRSVHLAARGHAANAAFASRVARAIDAARAGRRLALDGSLTRRAPIAAYVALRRGAFESATARTCVQAPDVAPRTGALHLAAAARCAVAFDAARARRRAVHAGRASGVGVAFHPAGDAIGTLDQVPASVVARAVEDADVAFALASEVAALRIAG